MGVPVPSRMRARVQAGRHVRMTGPVARLLIGAAVLAGAAPHVHAQRHAIDPLSLAYHEYCGVCHGENLEGTAQGTPLAGVALRYGDSAGEIGASIASGFPAQGMPGWSGILPETEIRKLAMYVSERRVNLDRQDTRRDMALAIPDGTVASALHDFRIESFAQGSDPHPFSIASLPDGRFLLTEKKRGLRIVSANGVVAPFVEGTPKTYAQDDPDDRWANPQHGVGWLLDVAAHPDYERNGWIYLQFGDRCSDCNASGGTVSMNRLVRGRIEDGRWIDEETLWRADLEDYTWRSDMGAGGRICFDGDGHVFLSIGVKGLATHLGIQDLSKPYGKVHRMRDDGRVPVDNPFVDVAGALPTIWTYGHRSPQGLEFNRHTERLWSTEMGPRGGDEINLLLPGRNYGWPLTSRGVEYDGTPVEYGEDLGITFALEDIEQPVVDLTPSPAVSSFVFYDGDAFPAWRNHMLVGSLRGADLFRVQVDGDRFVGKETLIEDLARIRDIEVGFDGLVYLVLEHATGWTIVRLAPVMEGTTALRDPLAEVRHESAWRRSPGRPPADP